MDFSNQKETQTAIDEFLSSIDKIPRQFQKEIKKKPELKERVRS